jgi:hypothetical protein
MLDRCSSSLDVTLALRLLETVLDRVLQLSSKVFILEFILDKLSSHMTSERRNEVANLCMGVKALRCIPQVEHEQYASLVRHPLLLFEQLLMNVKVEWARKVRASWVSKSETEGNVMKSASIISGLENLVIYYARKALEFPTFYWGQTSRVGSKMSTTEPPSNSGPGQRLSLVSPSPLHSLGSPGSKTRQRSASDAAPLFDSMALSLPPSLTSQPSFNPLTELPTTVPTREEWTKDEEVAACVVCHEHFSLVRTLVCASPYNNI